MEDDDPFHAARINDTEYVAPGTVLTVCEIESGELPPDSSWTE
jgi:hypothetical protein